MMMDQRRIDRLKDAEFDPRGAVILVLTVIVMAGALFLLAWFLENNAAVQEWSAGKRAARDLRASQAEETRAHDSLDSEVRRLEALASFCPGAGAALESHAGKFRELEYRMAHRPGPHLERILSLSDSLEGELGTLESQCLRE